MASFIPLFIIVHYQRQPKPLAIKKLLNKIIETFYFRKAKRKDWNLSKEEKGGEGEREEGEEKEAAAFTYSLVTI